MPIPCNAGPPYMQGKKVKLCNALNVVICFKSVLKSTIVVAAEMLLSHLEIGVITERNEMWLQK